MSRPTVLIVSADDARREVLRKAIEGEFHVLAADRAACLDALRTTAAVAVLLDCTAADPALREAHVALLLRIRRESAGAKVFALVPGASRDLGVRAVHLGAHDVLAAPVDDDLLRLLLGRAAWLHGLEQERVALAVEGEDEPTEMIGTSDAIRRVFAMIRKVATSDVSVLIAGESGTGKELTARAIHERSARAEGPFVTINCGAIPETLLEAELFGYERGAFTGALQQRKGRIEYAHRGTLFLDEVGELPLPLQVKLLRFLQDRTIERVGGRQPIAVDARILAATHVDLPAAIAAGRFREDLYYRLSVVTIALPPLRARGEDALLMARVFLAEACRQMRKRVRGFSEDALEAIRTYVWPGNVRELLNKVRRAVVMAEGAYVTPDDLDLPAPDPAGQAPSLSLRDARRRYEAELLARALALHDGNLTQVARRLRISRPALYKLLRRHGLQARVRVPRRKAG